MKSKEEREKSSQRIAIVGAGLCGLAVAWYLSEKFSGSITVFDENGVGGGASGIAAGLLHPFVGAHNKKNHLGDEGFEATKQLIQVAELALGKCVAEYSGLLRLATDDQQLNNYAKAALLYPEIEWKTAAENVKSIPGLQPFPGIFLKNAAVVDTKRYLDGLWIACSTRKVNLQLEKIHSLEQLDKYDVVVITAGAGCKTIVGLEDVKLNLVKGQVLTCSWSNEHPPLPCALNSYAYLIKGFDGKNCIAGATYEHNYKDSFPDRDFAIAEIIPKVQTYFPEINAANVIDCKAAFRASTPDRKPIMRQFKEKRWILSGMGSKGLLYHALYSKILTNEILSTQSRV